MSAIVRSWPQLGRRALQLGVVLFIVYAALGGVWRNYKVAHNSGRLVALMHGEAVGQLYDLNEDALSIFGEPYEQSIGFLGMPWASRVAGVDGADPIMVAAHVTTTGRVEPHLWWGLALSLGLALVLGKVFCSHLCPMRLAFELGQYVRTGLARLGLDFPGFRHEARFGGWVLIGGLLATAVAGTGVWFFILPYLALSASIFLWVAAGMGTIVIATAGVWLFIDVFAAPGYFCHNLCPTGFILEQVGRLAPFRLRKRGAQPCPDKCDMCQVACPYHLSPKDETHRPACDGCGRCVTACPKRRLSRGIHLPVIGALVVLALPQVARAHHNKGLPHYGYFENYPQVPTEEYVVVQGKWEFGATIFNFQGLDRRNADTPNDVKIYTYLYDLDADAPHRGAVDFEIRLDGATISRFERLMVDEEAVYSTRETLPQSGTYELVAVMGDSDVVLPFSIDLAGDGVNWLVVGAIGVPVLLVFGLAYLGRSQKRRRGRSRRRRAGVATAVVLLGVGLSAGVVRASEAGGERHTVSGTHERARGPTADPQGRVCPHCGMVDCTMEHVDTQAGEAVMVMGGIPLGLFLAGVGAILLLSFVGTEWLGSRVRVGFRLNLLGRGRRYRLLRSRWFQAIPQLVMVAVLGFLIYVGLFGSRLDNLTPVAVWTIWWGGLIFLVLLMGSAWCFMCPWDGLANLFTRLRLAARIEPLGLGVTFPRRLRSVYVAIGCFALLTWLELGFGITTNPRWTAYMGLAMAAAAIVFALLFDGKTFCAHVCPVGRICGIYSMFAPVEIRARKARTCQACRTEDCLHGNERGYPCPTGISLKSITSSSMCTMCTECIKSCNKHNIALNLRPFGSDLRQVKNPRLDEAWLALTLLTLTLFHGLTMTPAWEDFRPGHSSLLKWMAVSFETPAVLNFSVAMALVCAVPIGLYWASCRAAAWTARGEVSTRTLFVHYAYSLLPVALFYHLAHNLMHLLMEGGHIVPLLSDPMGDGSDLLGTAGVHTGHLIAESTMWYLQVGLILTGHIFGIVTAHRFAHALYREPRAATRSLLPMLLMMIAISVGGLYLMHLDMNMRIGRM
ncbi:4Fe-4S binding protein [Haliangium sp.]|uniref:4Fe-4S binding protein n=1 Tax=Haliangium sp. TaxID=2663208 RepID=UPI003D148606